MLDLNQNQNEKMRTSNDLSSMPGLAFLNYLGDGVMVLDNSRKILMVNPALENLLGWKASELVGQYCFSYLCCQHPATGTYLCQNLCPLTTVKAGSKHDQSVFYQDLMVLTKGGHRIEVSASFAPLGVPLLASQGNNPNSLNESPAFSGYNGDTYDVAFPEYSIVLLRDITEVKRQERIKTEFIAAASHQLRTPLSSIKTSIGLLQEHAASELNKPLKSLLNNIQSSSARMERIVNDLIELVNLQSGRVQMVRHTFEARDLVGWAVENCRERLQSKDQVLKWIFPDEALYVYADFSRMGEVLSHLITNASKFSARGKMINIELSSRTGDKGVQKEVVFCVRDDGIGIAEAERGLIFEKFYQSQITENTAEQGAGLGLPLAKTLVELNGGRLWFNSEAGKGSSFYFSLPLTHPYQINLSEGF
ncbi:MAG: hypothetical protein BGO39_20540 [Chloroflexi bacterium 54-19]|nr:MAG: hypothetical protein BGO39_20540 [Chloroflexi bacterium 54-19]